MGKICLYFWQCSHFELNVIFYWSYISKAKVELNFDYVVHSANSFIGNSLRSIVNLRDILLKELNVASQAISGDFEALSNFY